MGVHGIRGAARRVRVPRCRPSASISSRPMSAAASGMKNFLYPEWVLVLFAARRLGRPVAGSPIAPRIFVSAAQGRDNRQQGAARARRRRAVPRARRRDGRQSRRLSLDQRAGQLDQLAGRPRWAASTHIPAIFMAVQRRLHQHRADRRLSRRRQARGQLPHRAAGRAGGAPARHRSGRAAPAQRDPRHFPYRAALGSLIDSGSFAANLDAAVGAGRPHGLRGAARRIGQGAGRLRGLGVACFLETARGAPNEGAEVRFEQRRQGGARCSAPSRTARATRPASADRRRPAGPADRGVPLCPGRHARRCTSGAGHGGARSMHHGRRRAREGDRGGDRQGRAASRPICCKPSAGELGVRGRALRGARQRAAASTSLAVARAAAIRRTCPTA